MIAAGVVAMPAEPLLGLAAQNLDLGLMSARTAAVLRRVVAGETPDEVDLMVLRRAEELMSASAAAADVVAAGGQLRHPQGSLGFSAVALAVESAAPSMPAADVSKRLRSMAETLAVLQVGGPSVNAKDLLRTFSALADMATRHAGSAGEGNGALL